MHHSCLYCAVSPWWQFWKFFNNSCVFSVKKTFVVASVKFSDLQKPGNFKLNKLVCCFQGPLTSTLVLISLQYSAQLQKFGELSIFKLRHHTPNTALGFPIRAFSMLNWSFQYLDLLSSYWHIHKKLVQHMLRLQLCGMFLVWQHLIACLSIANRTHLISWLLNSHKQPQLKERQSKEIVPQTTQLKSILIIS